jgi:hypothetical protein
MTKQTLLADLQAEQSQFEGLLDQLGAARMDQPGVAGRWSIKDIVAHLTGWRRQTVARLQAARRGEGGPPPLWPANLQSDEAINAWLYEANRDRSVDDVRAESRQVFDELVAAIDAFPEAELLDPRRFAWWEGELLSAAGLFGHFHEEHEPDMRAWLAQRATT